MPIGTSKLVLILIFNFQIIMIYHFAGLPNGCDGALIEPNQILTIAAQANIAEISFGGDSAIVFDSFSEIAFGQGGNYCNDVDTNIKFYEAARDDFLSVENWEADGDLDDLDLLDIHRIPCKLVFWKHRIVVSRYNGQLEFELIYESKVGICREPRIG